MNIYPQTVVFWNILQFTFSAICGPANYAQSASRRTRQFFYASVTCRCCFPTGLCLLCLTKLLASTHPAFFVMQCADVRSPVIPLHNCLRCFVTGWPWHNLSVVFSFYKILLNNFHLTQLLLICEIYKHIFSKQLGKHIKFYFQNCYISLHLKI